MSTNWTFSTTKKEKRHQDITFTCYKFSILISRVLHIHWLKLIFDCDPITGRQQRGLHRALQPRKTGADRVFGGRRIRGKARLNRPPSPSGLPTARNPRGVSHEAFTSRDRLGGIHGQASFERNGHSRRTCSKGLSEDLFDCILILERDSEICAQERYHVVLNDRALAFVVL